MTNLRRFFMTLTLACGLSVVPCRVFASRKATDLMSQALKQKASGNLAEAISSLEYASEQATNQTQQHLAMFMLGDCQLEAGRFSDAANTFSKLSDSVKSSEEKAEALFRLLQAHSGLGNKSRVNSIYSQIRRDHGKSPYFDLARSFVNSRGLLDAAEIQPAKPTPVARPVAAPAPAVAVKPAAKPVVRKQEIEEPLPDEYVEADPELVSLEQAAAAEQPVAAKPQVKTVETSVAQPKATPRPVETAAARPAQAKKKADSETSSLLRAALSVETAVGAEKDDLIGEILRLQDSLKDGAEKNSGMDKVLFELAKATAKFGELLEACKTYDKLLTLHPASPLVERAYFEAIRLRAVLGVHEAVIGWSKAFLAAFPASEYRGQVRALVEYAQAGGNIDYNQGAPARSTREKKPTVADASTGIDTENAALTADSQYVAASKKMKDGKYSLALVDFNRLSRKYPNAPQIWWDTALVNVQLEDFKKASQAIGKMLELDPGNQDANSLSGYIHYRLENFEEAASAYDQAGEPEGRGVNFFDAKNASERMKKTAGKNSRPQ